MSYVHMCSKCATYTDWEYHSTYLGHPIVFRVSAATGKRHYHSNAWEHDTLAGIRQVIRIAEGREV